MKSNNRLNKLEAAGWLKERLLLQKNGLTGQLEDIWPDVSTESQWLGGKGENWERGPYYCDGLIALAYILDDEELKEKAQKWVDYAIESQKESGFFGPETNTDYWPRSVMIKGLIRYYENTFDDRVIPFLKKYYLYMLNNIDSTKLQSFAKVRACESLLGILWLYQITGEAFLLLLCDKICIYMTDWTEIYNKYPFVREANFYFNWDLIKDHSWDKIAAMIPFHETHCVNNAMAIKSPAMKYLLYNKSTDKQAVYNGINSLLKYHGIGAGIFTGDEHLGGQNPSRGIELCQVVEYMYSLEILYKIFHDYFFIEKLETVAFNLLPAAITKDMCTHQYMQQPNQISVAKEPHIFFNVGDDANTFSLEPYFGCCTANLHQGYPKFAAFLVHSNGDRVDFAAYAPCKAKLDINSSEVIIEENTRYPYSNKIEWIISADNSAFTLSLRIPEFTDSYLLVLNGRELKGEEIIIKDRRVSIYRKWNKDTLVLNINSAPRVEFLANNSITVKYGSLVYALPLNEQWINHGGTGVHADWEVKSNDTWNYALVIDRSNPSSSFQIVEGNDYYRLECYGIRIPGWKEEKNCAGEIPISPVRDLSGQKTKLTLIPYEFPKLRISQFPWVENEVNESKV